MRNVQAQIKAQTRESVYNRVITGLQVQYNQHAMIYGSTKYLQMRIPTLAPNKQ